MVADTEYLPPQDIGTLFYQKYEPREVLGKGASSTVRRCLLKAVYLLPSAKSLKTNENCITEIVKLCFCNHDYEINQCFGSVLVSGSSF